jgi:AraC-like DNA-binding protein
MSFLRQNSSATIGEFVQRLRIEAAGEMLRRSETPLSELALQLGFADQSHFSRVFRRWTGMTPRAWRALTTNRGTGDE